MQEQYIMGLALSFSAADCASPVWCQSAHTSQLDPDLNSACHATTGCLKPTDVKDLHLLSDIAPQCIRRTVAWHSSSVL